MDALPGEDASGANAAPLHSGDATGQVRNRESAKSFWAAVVVTIGVAVLLLLFILNNGKDVQIKYLGASWTAPVGVALLLAALFGGLVIVLAVATRVLQLRRRARAKAASQLD